MRDIVAGVSTGRGMIFWIVVIFVGGLISLLFLDAIREHTLTSALVFSVAFFFLWRTYGFVVGADIDDWLIWQILGTTLAVMVVVGAVGRWWLRRK